MMSQLGQLRGGGVGTEEDNEGFLIIDDTSVLPWPLCILSSVLLWVYLPFQTVYPLINSPSYLAINTALENIV